MCCTSQNNPERRQTKKRFITFAFLIYFIVVSLLLEAYILTHADHEHDHNGSNGGCAICAQLQNAENVLKQLGMAAAAGLLFKLAGLFAATAIIKVISTNITILTPVTLKIRMNN